MVLGARTGRGFCEKCGGCLRNLILILGGIGIAFSIMASLSCKFVTGKFATTSWGNQAGLFFWKDPVYENPKCEFWPSDNPWERFIRISAILSPMFAIWGMFIIVFQIMCCNIWCVDAMVSGSFLASVVLQGCTFFMFWTDHCNLAGTTCDLDTGGWFSIISMCFYGVAGILICCSPKTEPWMMRDYPSKTDDKEDEENPSPQPAEQAPPQQQQQQSMSSQTQAATPPPPAPISSSLNNSSVPSTTTNRPQQQQEISREKSNQQQQHYNEHHTNSDMDIPSPPASRKPPPPKKKKKKNTNNNTSNTPQAQQQQQKKKKQKPNHANSSTDEQAAATTNKPKQKKKKKVPAASAASAHDEPPPGVMWPDPIEDDLD